MGPNCLLQKEKMNIAQSTERQGYFRIFNGSKLEHITLTTVMKKMLKFEANVSLTLSVLINILSNGSLELLDTE